MTEQSYDYDDPDQNEDPADGKRNWRRDLEDQARKGKEAQEQLQQQMEETRKAQRELAMMRAGIDLDTPLGQMFSKANPELVDVDTIRSEWQKVTPAQAPSGDQAAMQRISQAQAGGDPSGGNVPQFASALDQIPVIVDGNYNPDYANQVLQATSEQAAREGRPFEVSQGNVTWQRGASGPGPVTAELPSGTPV